MKYLFIMLIALLGQKSIVNWVSDIRIRVECKSMLHCFMWVTLLHCKDLI